MVRAARKGVAILGSIPRQNKAESVFETLRALDERLQKRPEWGSREWPGKNKWSEDAFATLVEETLREKRPI